MDIRTLNDGVTTLDPEVVEAFASTLRGELLHPGSSGYDESRTIWNAMIDRHPGGVVKASGPRDVMSTVRFARDHGLLLSIKGAGHNIAGSAVHDGALMLDLSGLRSVHVDPVRRVARVEPGCTLGDLDHETQAFGLAVPTGINSTTGIAGLTVGGGFGWLSRKHGLTIDSLISADVVLADGSLVRASADENPDLFWGIRGGGGNFGVVISFEFQLHPVGPQVTAGLIVHPFEGALDHLKAARDFAMSAPDELTVWVVVRKAPPLPFLPEEVHGTLVVILATLYAGDVAEGEAALAELRAYGNPIADVIGPAPFAGFQTAFDPLLTPGERNYWKSHNFADLTDEALGLVVEFAGTLPDPQSEIFLARMGGETSRIPEDSTAFPGRDAEWVMNVHGRWSDPGLDETCVQWARKLFDAMAPHSMGTAYVNFMPADEADRIQEAYGDRYDRLVELKNRYDPTNLFRLNHNVAPTT